MKSDYIPSAKLKENHQPPPVVPIAGMLTIADRIYEETGHYPSFGQIQVGIDSGKINPEKYLGRRPV